MWAIGRRASPSSLVNSIVIDLTQMTSAPMTNIRNDFSCASSMPLTKRFRYCNVVCSELLIGWTLLACIIPMTFLFVGSMSSNMLYSPSSDDNLLSCKPVCKTSFQESAMYWGFWTISLWATSNIRLVAFSLVGIFLHSKRSSKSTNSSLMLPSRIA